MSTRFAWIVGALLVCTSSLLSAQNCLPPLPFLHSFQNQGTAALQGTNAAISCALNASINAAAGPTAAAILHYRRPTPATSLRYSFRMESSAIAPFLMTGGRAVQVFSTSAANPDGLAHVLLISLIGQTTGPVMRIYAACSGTASHLCLTNQALTQNLNILRFEINIGASTAGSVRYWVNADFTDPPTGINDNHGVGLDNTASGGILAAEIGMSSGSPLFRNSAAGAAVIFDQIQSSDDLLFWQNFESDLQ